MAINSVQVSSKSELSSTTFGHFKVYAIYEKFPWPHLEYVAPDVFACIVGSPHYAPLKAALGDKNSGRLVWKHDFVKNSDGKAPIGTKFCQNAFRTIPDISFFDAENQKKNAEL